MYGKLKHKKSNRKATKSKKKGGGFTKRKQGTIFWFITVDDDIKKLWPFLTEDIVGHEIQSILTDPLGWKRFGYNFVQMKASDGLETRRSYQMRQKVFHIRLASNDSLKKECSLDYLSCAEMVSKWTLINVDRWLQGSAYSELPLNEYRKYVINHEIGHLLGRGHKKWPIDKTKKCYIMNQQTLANGRCIGNPYPLDDE